MLCVEISTIFLNIQWWLEQTEQTHSNFYGAIFYTTYVSWFIVRVVNPIYVVILMIDEVFPHYWSMFWLPVFVLVLVPWLSYVRGKYCME